MFGHRARGSGLLLAALLGGAAASRAQDRPSLVLITLDTTRSDYVGRMETGKPVTPNLDRLARAGVRFTRALTASPLTLPAHCSLMTGANPPAHGVRDNGASALPADLPTLASSLSSKGYSTAAFVASRVLDRRFGLDRGFALYDDAMTAEDVGEQGYPERRAAAVTDAALAWAKENPASGPSSSGSTTTTRTLRTILPASGREPRRNADTPERSHTSTANSSDCLSDFRSLRRDPRRSRR
jgi:hypothetical protein